MSAPPMTTPEAKRVVLHHLHKHPGTLARDLTIPGLTQRQVSLYLGMLRTDGLATMERVPGGNTNAWTATDG